MDYARIQRRDAGYAAGSLINPTQKKPAKNFAAANVAAMRAKASAAKEKAIVEQPKAPFKMKQFDGVQGKVQFEAHKPPRENVAPAKPFLQRGEGKMAQPQLPEGGAEPRRRAPLAEQRPVVPKAAEAPAKPVHEKRNHILVNRLIADQVGQERRAPEKAKNPVEERIKHQFGKVPAYLSGIKQDLADQKRFAEEQSRKEDVPPGYRLLPDEEREETLQNLREKLADFEGKFQALPLRIESDRAKRQQRDIETKINELESAIKLFSKPKVLIEL
jgi:hypothetical protein